MRRGLGSLGVVSSVVLMGTLLLLLVFWEGKVGGRGVGCSGVTVDMSRVQETTVGIHKIQCEKEAPASFWHSWLPVAPHILKLDLLCLNLGTNDSARLAED